MESRCGPLESLHIPEPPSEAVPTHGHEGRQHLWASPQHLSHRTSRIPASQVDKGCPSPPEPASVSSRSSPLSGRAGWERCIAPAIRNSAVTWRSRSYRANSPPTQERLARFRREAHLLASLNHQNVASIYGLDEADGKPFLVLELVDGEELSARLTRGAIPVEESLEIARQIAEALEEAHEHGIVHRDLKPANIKLTRDGKVKVLDFGLAKAYAVDEPEATDESQSPTMSARATAAGLLLGTAAYMSPEQARGEAGGQAR